MAAWRSNVTPPTTVTFDTRNFIRGLMESGIPEDQAEAIAEAFQVASGEAELATKRDLREMELRLEAKIGKAISNLKVALIKGVTDALIAQAAVIATLLKLF